MMHKQENIWISIFERSGQRFICGVCGFAGEFNSFRQAFSGGGTEVIFFCHSCGNALVFDTETKTMRANSGEMIRPEVSLGVRWSWVSPKVFSLAALGVSVLILILTAVMFFRMESRIGRLDDRLVTLSTRPAQAPGALGRVDFKDPGAQEIGQGYAILPRSATSESGGVRVRGVVVNEKSLAVDAEFRFTLGDRSESFTVANLSPGTGEPFEVFLPGASEASGPALVEVLATNLHLD
jgi:hypothetical protein